MLLDIRARVAAKLSVIECLHVQVATEQLELELFHGSLGDEVLVLEVCARLAVRHSFSGGQNLQVATLQLELEFIHGSLEDEVLDIAPESLAKTTHGLLARSGTSDEVNLWRKMVS